MKLHRAAYRVLPIALLLLVLPAAVLADKKEEKSAPVIRVAVLPIMNTTDDVGATRIMEDIIKDQLKKIDASRAHFLLSGDVERLLSDANQLARADQISDRWARTGAIDSSAVNGLDSLLMVDAILLVQVSEWENHRVPVVGQGQSHTTVALSFALVDVQNDRVIWSKRPREQRFAAELDVSSANVNYDETGVIQRKSDNAPPRFESVASDLIREAFKKFPRG
jgi:hypothetical protein